MQPRWHLLYAKQIDPIGEHLSSNMLGTCSRFQGDYLVSQMEIERRFFVQDIDDKPWMDNKNCTAIRQYYLDSERISCIGNLLMYDEKLQLTALSEREIHLFEENKEWTSRIRVCDNTIVLLTLKGRREYATALELEWNMDLEVATKILDQQNYPAVIKSRYLWTNDDGMEWEIDCFEGSLEGLILAEIELPNFDFKIHLPKWLGIEITGAHQWSNSSLAHHGLPEKSLE